jgi:ABC-type metal ion transport system substrate-binding protein
MIESLLNEENKNKIKSVINNFIWPIKVYSIIIVFILMLNTFYIYKLYSSINYLKCI